MSDAPTYPAIRDVGLSAMIVTFAGSLSEPANRAALAFRAAVDAAGWQGVEETAISLASTFIRFDPLALAHDDLQARLAALLAKHHQHDAAAGNAPDMLKMATYDGARALGIDDITGSLEVGKQADFITVDSTALGMLPLYNPFAALIHGNAGNAVDNVYIGGQALVQEGQLTKLSLTELAQQVMGVQGAV